MEDAARFTPSSSSSFFFLPSSSSSFFIPSSSSSFFVPSPSSSFFVLSSSSSFFFAQPSSASSFFFLPSSSTFYRPDPTNIHSYISRTLYSIVPATPSSPFIPPQTITLPLTTIFTPPPDCTKPVLAEFWTPLVAISQAPGLIDAYKRVPTCYPTSFVLENYVALYSPGVCPSGYTTAEQRELANQTLTSTFTTCCPSDASLVKTETYGLCHSSVVPAVTMMNEVFRSTYTVYNKYAIVVAPITVGWQSSDLPNLPTPVIAANGNNRSTTIAAASHHRASMSSGTKAGVSVGAAAGAIAIIGSLVWVMMRLRKRKSQQSPSQEDCRDDTGGAMGGQRQSEQRRGPTEMSSSEPLRPELESSTSFTVYR